MSEARPPPFKKTMSAPNFPSLNIFIENPKGSYKSFETEGDPVWQDYPLKGVTYPVDYGFIEGYKSEDGHDLDVFRGSGTQHGYIRIWRCDVPIETKFALFVTDTEWAEIKKAFVPVIKESALFETDVALQTELEKFR